MIHYLYVGHFERDGTFMKLKKSPWGVPRPVVVRRLDMAIVREILEEEGIAGMRIPEDWWLGIEEEGFILCDAHTHNRDAIDYVRKLAKRTGCDIFYDGTLFIPPHELEFAWNHSERRL